MTWEEWQRTFWSSSEWERTYQNRKFEAEGAGLVTYYQTNRVSCQDVKDRLEADGVEGLEIIAPGQRGNNTDSYRLIQNPNLMGQKTEHINLLD